MDYCEAIKKNDLAILIWRDIHRKLLCETNRLHKTVYSVSPILKSQSNIYLHQLGKDAKRYTIGHYPWLP